MEAPSVSYEPPRHGHLVVVLPLPGTPARFKVWHNQRAEVVSALRECADLIESHEWPEEHT